MKLNDYMSAGRPTVATAVGDVTQTMEEYEIGLLSQDTPRHSPKQLWRFLPILNVALPSAKMPAGWLNPPSTGDYVLQSSNFSTRHCCHVKTIPCRLDLPLQPYFRYRLTGYFS